MTLKIGALACAAGFLLAAGAAAQTGEAVPLIPREILFGNPEKAGPQISPDGLKLAYLAPDEKGVRNVWVRTLGKSDDRVITSDPKRGISAYFWRGDSQHILYVQDTGGDEDFHLYQTAISNRETKDLTPFEKVRAMIVMADARFPDEMLVALNKRDKRLHDVYRLNLKTGDLKVEAENPGDIAGWTANNAMQVRAAQAMLPGGIQDIRVRENDSAPWKSIQKWGPDENMGGVAGFTPDDKALYLISSVGANTSRLIEADLATLKEKVVASDSTYDVTTAITHPRTQKIEAIGFLKQKLEWQFFDPEMKKDMDALGKVRAGEINIASRDLNDKKWIVVFSAPDSPAQYYAYDRAAKKAEFLFAARPKLANYKLAKMRPIAFKSRDGLNIEGYLTMPIGVEKNAPTVILVHGGPWGRDSYGYSGLVQMLANRGYAVVQPNFRGSTGYGKAFLNAGDREWAGKMHDDIIDAKRWAIAQGFADPKRIAIMGGSYGGYATLVGLTFTPDEFTCGVDIVGPSNLFTLLKTIPPYWAPMKALFDKRVGNLEKEEDFLRARSPLFKAGSITKPLLIGQGANDPRVKQAESDQIVKAMRDNQKPVEYVLFPDEGHGFARPENSLRFFAATESFLQKYMGGRAEPPSEAHDWKPFLK